MLALPICDFWKGDDGTSARFVLILDSRVDQSLARLEAIAKLMDGAFNPATTIRVGFDGIIGSTPMVGDMLAGLVGVHRSLSSGKQNSSARHMVGPATWLIARMRCV